jgi:hypothetical protein
MEKSIICCADRCAAIALILPIESPSFTRRVVLSPPFPGIQHTRPHFNLRGHNVSQRVIGVPGTDELNELARMLAKLRETAQGLPAGVERDEAVRQIGNFERRFATLVARAA